MADVQLAPALKRGDAGYNGKPAVILSVQKQPSADSVTVTREVKRAIADLAKSLPPGVKAPQFLFKQADFIKCSVSNVEEALRDGAILVAVILFLFLLKVRTTLISLAAIPVSLLSAALIAVVVAGATIPFFPRAFLPPFNEGILTVNVVLNPGTALAEQIVKAVPEVTQVGRRSGRGTGRTRRRGALHRSGV